VIVVMSKNATPVEVQHMIERVEGLGLKPHVLYGIERTVVAAIGPERDGLKESLEAGQGVAEVLPILAPYKIASLETKNEPTVVKVGSLQVGGSRIGVIAGPCSVESEEQILSTAQALKEAGASRWCIQAAHQPLQFPGHEGEGAPASCGRA